MAYRESERNQAMEAFAEFCRRHDIMPGHKVPGELALSADLGLSRHMVRQLLDSLTEAGVVQRRGRSGTYLLRRPESGSVPVSARSLAPVKTGSRTVSVMLSSRVPESVLRDVQAHAMSNEYLVQYYFGPDHAAKPDNERSYLEQAIRNGYCGALIHPTPLAPRNEAVFRDASAQLRLAHIGYHSTELPEQSFFLPDLTFAGSACANTLLQSGVRRIRLISSLPADHHITELIARGVRAAVTPSGIPFAITSVYAKDEATRLSLKLDDAEEGLVLYHDERLPLFDVSTSRAMGLSSRAIWLRETAEQAVDPSLPAFVFDWRRHVLDALDFIMSNSESVCHRLYLPTFRPSGVA